MAAAFPFLPLLLILLLAFLIPVLVSRVRWLPVIVAEILAGALIGRSGLDLVRPDMTLDFLAEVGLAILMFLSGLEVDFSLLSRAEEGKRPRGRSLGLALATFLITLACALAAAAWLAGRGLSRDIGMAALILSTTSLGVVVPVLKERGLSATPFGQTVLLSALAADFLTMFLITVFVTIRSKGLSLEILLTGALFVAALFVYRVGLARGRRRGPAAILLEIVPTASQHKVQGAIALMVGFVILAEFIGTEMILGAFLAGAVLSLLGLQGDERTRHGLEAIGFGFFIPVFFIAVGTRFDLRALIGDPAALRTAVWLLGIAVAIKLLSALPLKLAFTWRETAAAGALLSARLSLIIAAAGIGLQLGILDEPAYAGFILIAALTSTAAPIAFNSLIPRAAEARGRSILLFGAGDLGLQVARELARRGDRPLIMTGDAERRARAEELGFTTVGLAGPEDWTGSLDVRRLKSLLLLDSDDDRNLAFGGVAAAAGAAPIIASVNNPSRLPEYQAAGVRALVPGLVRSALLALMARNPAIFELMMADDDGREVLEFRLSDEAAAGRAVKDLHWGEDILLLAVSRGSETLIPHGRTVLRPGDRLTVLGTDEAVRDLADRLGDGLYPDAAMN
jgi:Kef-type K+ transport system membrane component KefB